MHRNQYPESAEKYPAPRDDALRYPGQRPNRSFVLADQLVWTISYNNESKGSTGLGQVFLDSNDQYFAINKFLASRQAASLEERFPVIGYGSNPVPGQLLSKLGQETIVPVVLGKIQNSDLVYNLISNMGYVFAEMIFNEGGSEGNVGVTFLDRRQLEIMIESEQNYYLAYSPADVILESGEKLLGGENNALYIFAGFRKIWIPAGYDGPIAIAELFSSGRRLKSLNQIETLELVIEQFNLKKKGLSTPRELAERLRCESQLDEKPGKLKYDLQKAVDGDPRSLPPLAESLTLVDISGSLNTYRENSF